MFETILYSVTDHLATIAFNRPESMNAFDNKMADELVLITDEIRANPSIRAVLLCGTGHLFMAGGDLKFFHDRLDTMPAGVMKIVRALNASILNLMQMPKPVLASVHGSVAGVGMSFLLASDLVIAANTTKFTMAYSGIGISPDGGASFHLPRLVGVKKAMEWLLLSEVFDAEEAKQCGLINWTVPDESLKEETQRILNRLANGPTQSYSQIKKLVNETWQTDLTAQLEKEGRAFEACSVTTDFKSGVTSFLQKKKPAFMGK